MINSLMCKELTVSKTVAQSALEEIGNPNRCIDRNSKVVVLQRLVVRSKIEAIKEAMTVHGAYVKISPGFASMRNLLDDYIELEKNL